MVRLMHFVCMWNSKAIVLVQNNRLDVYLFLAILLWEGF